MDEGTRLGQVELVQEMADEVANGTEGVDDGVISGDSSGCIGGQYLERRVCDGVDGKGSVEDVIGSVAVVEAENRTQRLLDAVQWPEDVKSEE